MSVTDELLANNARYAESFEGPLPLPPSKKLAVVACMDARLDVYRILGLEPGEAPDNHSNLVVFDEEPLPAGVALYAQMALRALTG